MADDLIALIVAGGSGSRMASELPKQFLKLKTKTVIQWSFESFESQACVKGVVLVFPKEWMDHGRNLLANMVSSKPLKIVPGGERRQDSVKAGLAAIPSENFWVAVHDGARPGLPPDLIPRAFESAKKNGNAVLAVPIFDTLVKAVDNVVTDDIDRSTAFSIQTPQIFPAKVLRKAIEFANHEGFEATDDSRLVRKMGQRIHLFPGSSSNMKITRPEDLRIVEHLLP